jgi:hypothetical protein
MLKYSHPVLAVFVHYWPSMILLPAILVLIALLAVITRWWEDRDHSDRDDSDRQNVMASPR